MKKTILGLFLACLLVFTSIGAPAAAASLPLDLRGHWAASYAITLLENGVITGDPDGRYHPGDYLTREEAAALLARLFAGKGLPTVRQGAAPYTDIAGRWSQSAIQTLWAAGILDEGTQFRPAAAISRADIARYIAYLTVLTEQPEEEPLPEEPAEPPVEELPAEEPAPDEELPAEEPTPDEEQTPAEEPAPDEEQPTEEPAPDEEQTPVEEPAPDEEQPTEEPTPDQEQTPTEEPPAEEPAPEEEPDDGPDTLDEVRARLAAGAPAAFPDLPAGEVAACVQYLDERGIIIGDNTGLYHPGNPLTRGETAALLFRVSGLPLSQTTFPALPTKNVISVPYISQVYPVYAPVGCEPTSLLMGLQAKGYATNVTLRQFLDAMPKTTSNPAKGFVGSPYRADPTKKTRTTIYPTKLAEYGRQYGNVIDLTGATTQQIQLEVLSGNPVVAYVTLYWQTPYYRYYNIEGQTQRLLSNNHAVLVCGYNAANHTYYIADPYNVSRPQQPYFYWVSGYLFDELYNVRHHALAIA